MQATCQWNECAATLEKPARGRLPKWCSDHRNAAYRRNHSADSRTTFCTEPGCNRPHRAKGMCSMHYRRGKQITMITIPCDGCGASCQKEPSRLNKYPTLYCTPKCKTEHQWRDLWASRKVVVIYDPAAARANKSRPIRRMGAATRNLTFRCVNCAVCSVGFVTQRHDVTCGEVCQREWTKHQRQESAQRRRARQRDAYRAPVRRMDIYARDDYTCQLCGEAMHMDAIVPHSYAPTIDHILPLARGGTHEPSNVQSAHFICNSTKGDRVHIEAVDAMALT